jgi:hypothetical protein
MSRFARRGHHDGNHAQLAKVFQDLGCSVADTSAAGFGFPDITLGSVGPLCQCDLRQTETSN